MSRMFHMSYMRYNCNAWLLEPLNDGMVKSDEKKQQYYSILLRETIRLSNLIDDMLELSRIQTSERTIDLGPVTHNDLIDMAIALMFSRTEGYPFFSNKYIVILLFGGNQMLLK